MKDIVRELYKYNKRGIKYVAIYILLQFIFAMGFALFLYQNGMIVAVCGN